MYWLSYLISPSVLPASVVFIYSGKSWYDNMGNFLPGCSNVYLIALAKPKQQRLLEDKCQKCSHRQLQKKSIGSVKIF